MKRLLIHTGPPKTATTSLQVLLGELKIPDSIYIGIFQPRIEKRVEGLNKLGSKILRYIRGGNDKASREDIRNRIQKLFEQYDTIIYSEEMILHKGRWTESIERLYDLFGDFDVSLSYCLRDARKVVPSYYSESYGYLAKPFQKDFQKFLRSEWLGIYDLENVFEQFRKAGFRRINCFDFENFVSGKLSLNSIFNTKFENEVWSEPLMPGVKNKKSIQTSNSSVKGELRYSVIVDKYKYLPRGLRKAIGKFKSIGLEVIPKALKKLMIEKRELAIPPSSFLEELYLRNSSFRERI